MAEEIKKGIQDGMKESNLSSLLNLIKGAMVGIKPLVDLIDRFAKVVMGLLAPIFTAITILLMPILKLLKPIVIVVNKLMQPFLRLAMETLREGGKKQKAGQGGALAEAFAASSGIILSGLSLILAFALKQTVQNTVNTFTFIIEAFFNLLVPGLNVSLEGFRNGTEMAMNTVFELISTPIIDGAARLADNFVKETDSFVTEAKSKVDAVIKPGKEKNNMTDVVSEGSMDQTDAMQSELENIFGNNKEGVMQKIIDEKINGDAGLRSLGTKRVRGIISNANKRAASILRRARSKASSIESAAGGE